MDNIHNINLFSCWLYLNPIKVVSVQSKKASHYKARLYDVAGSLNNLAKLYSILSRYQDAEAYYQEALEICEKTLGKEHPITVKIRTHLKAEK